MGTSTVRGVILAAAVLLGVVGVAKAIPSNGSRNVVPLASSSKKTTQPPSPTPTKTLPPKEKKPRTKGVTVQFLNGSHTNGLAGNMTNTLKSADLGFKLLIPGNAAKTDVTTIYYKPGFKDTGELLIQKYFEDALLKPTATASYQAKITVVLGSDFAATVSPTPSP